MIHGSGQPQMYMEHVSFPDDPSFPFLVHTFWTVSRPSFPRFLRVSTASPRRFQRAPSQNPGPRNGGTGAKRGELLRSTRFSVAAYLRVCVDDRQHHTLRRLLLQREVQRQLALPVLLGAGLRARRP